MFARKELIIPVSSEDFLRWQTEQTLAKQSSSVSPRGRLSDSKNTELLSKFIEITQCDEDTARFFLQEKNYNFVRALGLYYAQQDEREQQQKIGQTPLQHTTSASRSSTKTGKEEEEEIWIDLESNHYAHSVNGTAKK